MADALDYDFELMFPAAPASGAQVVLIDSALLPSPNLGKEAKRVIINVRSSAASAALGLEFQASWDGGTTWNDIASFTVPALTVGVPFSIYDVPLAYPRWRAVYTNSAAVITTWQGNSEVYYDVRGSAA